MQAKPCRMCKLWDNPLLRPAICILTPDPVHLDEDAFFPRWNLPTLWRDRAICEAIGVG